MEERVTDLKVSVTERTRAREKLVVDKFRDWKEWERLI